MLTLALAPLVSRADDEATLHLGDPAPALALKKFVKGEPVKAFEKGKVYVVEFWATWSRDFLDSMPHLAELQKAYPDITFIGVDKGEEEKKVAQFVRKMGDKMNCRVAADDLDSVPGGATHKAYMAAANQDGTLSGDGIPTAFVVDKEARIAWIGHPDALPAVLKDMAAGAFDMKESAQALARRNEQASKDHKETAALLAGMLGNRHVDPLDSKRADNDFRGVLKEINERLAAEPTAVAKYCSLQVFTLADSMGDTAAAAKRAGEVIDQVENGQALSYMAYDLANAEDTTPEILALARRLAEKALAKDPGNLDYIETLARVYAAGNDFAKAIEIETQALEKLTDGAKKNALAESLNAYKAGKIPEEKRAGVSLPGGTVK